MAAVSDAIVDACRPLAVVRDFINTLNLPDGPDEIGTPASLRDWLVERALLDPEDTVTPPDVTAAQALREALRDVTGMHAGEGPPPEASVAVLAAAGERVALRFRIDPERMAPVLAPAARGIEGAFGRLLGIVYDAARDGTWERLKACRKHSCRFAFFDYSKNRTGCWCSMKVCGNQEKAARRRARARGDASVGSGTNEA